MTEPTVQWYYDAATEESTGTRTYPNQEVGTATSWTSNYTIYNVGDSTASSCYIYVDDVGGIIEAWQSQTMWVAPMLKMAV